MNGILFATALVPTIGHARLIRFSEGFCKSFGGKLTVVISSRSIEPEITRDRVEILRTGFPEVNFIDHFDDDAPQNPATDEEWSYWTSMIPSDTEYLFGSDTYGVEFAARAGLNFIPCDPYREVYDTRGTEVRSRLPFDTSEVYEPWVLAKKTNYVFFGQESVGKTTLAKHWAGETGTPFFHEWARPYLETVGSEVTLERMVHIGAAQSIIDAEARNYPALTTFQDTDIVSTYGYAKFWCPEHIDQVVKPDWDTLRKKNHYLVLDPSGINFEPDPLRYGGDIRETNLSFWTDILDEHGLRWTLVTGSKRFNDITKIIKQPYEALIQFTRD